MSEPLETTSKLLDLRAATMVGVGAIVGGGILVLAGVAFETTGPSALLAFLFNGFIALLTALSFAEISTAFPESGGAYTFAKKVLSVRIAFAVGWFMWFAYIVAGVLYALGFAAYASLLIESCLALLEFEPPAWLGTRTTSLLFAVLASIAYSISLIRKSTGGGQWATIGKVVVFVILIAAGLIALVLQPVEQTSTNLTPFFTAGSLGLLSAMGFTFIALQGFDLIATLAGEVERPTYVIPRAMLLSLGIALVIYIPLLFLVSAVGVPPGQDIASVASRHPETVVALAAHHYMGPLGYWLVIVAAIMATLSALHANILAASRVALSMAQDHTLPKVLTQRHPTRQTPVMAIYATSLTLVAITLMVPNIANAGAAASLIFLLSFALTHLTTFLARRRVGKSAGGFHTPLFPLIPLAGGVSCGALAIFQAITVPSAGLIGVFWLGLGVLLYASLFAKDAELIDASAEGLDPTLVQLRGRSPFVLLPVANPAHAQAMVGIANALAPSHVGRVLLLSIVTARGREQIEAQLTQAQAVLRAALSASYFQGHKPEALITRAPTPWDEIRRVASHHRCESMLLGLGQLSSQTNNDDLRCLIEDIGCDLALMKSPPGWQLNAVTRILVPIAGRGREHGLRARFLGSMCRGTDREVTFLCIVPTSTSPREIEEKMHNISRLADVKLPSKAKVEVMRSDSPSETILEQASSYDLIILGLGQLPHTNLLENPALRVAHECDCAAILLSRHTNKLTMPAFMGSRS